MTFLPNIRVTLKKISSEYQPYACGIFFASLDLEQKASFMMVDSKHQVIVGAITQP
jgi:hypothetical protein